jgi:hypothetical protein
MSYCEEVENSANHGTFVYKALIKARSSPETSFVFSSELLSQPFFEHRQY